MGLAPLGCAACAPHYLWQYNSNNGECVEEINDIIMEFNFAMRYMVEELSNDLVDANVIFCEAFEASMDIMANRIHYGFFVNNLVRMYVICGVMNDAQKVFEKSVVRRGELMVLWNVMIDGYVRTGDFEAARILFDKMPKRSVVSWNGMIAGYAQNKFYKEALEMFYEMQMGNVNPNYVTLVSVLPAISRLGALELGKWVHLYAKKNEIEVNDVQNGWFDFCYDWSHQFD